MSKHTEIPWRYEAATETIRSIPANYWVGSVNSWDGATDNEANAEFIIRAVNNHEALIEALQQAHDIAFRLLPKGIRKSFSGQIGLAAIQKLIWEADPERLTALQAKHEAEALAAAKEGGAE